MGFINLFYLKRIESNLKKDEILRALSLIPLN